MDEILNEIVNGKYIDTYNNLLLNDSKIISTDSLVDIFKTNTEKSKKEDAQIKNQLDNINDIITKINDKFVHTYNLCSDYIDYYEKTKYQTNEVYDMFNKSIFEILEKNKKYNEMVDKLLEEYKNQFNEYSKNKKMQCNTICIKCLKEFPKNHLVQLIVSMIILQDFRNKTNIKFKEILISEIQMQKNEINNQIRIIDKLDMNSSIFDECFNMKEMITKIEDNLTVDI